jgi:hypothetical protein
MLIHVKRGGHLQEPSPRGTPLKPLRRSRSPRSQRSVATLFFAVRAGVFVSRRGRRAARPLYPKGVPTYCLPDHCVVIKYMPFVGDSKRALDEYTASIFMGGQQTIVMHNTCEDSLLATPLILDLAILCELFQRIEVKYEGAEDFEQFHSVLSVLSYMLKAPFVPQGTPVINALNRQRQCLENIMRALFAFHTLLPSFAAHAHALTHFFPASPPTPTSQGVGGGGEAEKEKEICQGSRGFAQYCTDQDGDLVSSLSSSSGDLRNANGTDKKSVGALPLGDASHRPSFIRSSP